MNAATAEFAQPDVTPSAITPGEADTLYEVVNGRVVELEPMGAFDTTLATELAFFLRLFAREHRLGVVATETLFILNEEPRLRRRPDVAYVGYSRWPAQTVPRTEAWNVVPDLAVEVISRTNIADTIDEKVIEYFAAGVSLVWVIYPETQRVYVYNSANQITVCQQTESLTGGDVLPGFELAIDELFAGLSKP